MWQELWTCMAQRHVALCIPGANGPIELVYWYGVLASVGIFLGALYASKHLDLEGEDPDIVWDALLWVLIPALLGGRLWYVAQAVLGGSTAYSLSRPLEILNPRLGGLNIFGAIAAGIIATIIYARVKKVNWWVVADASLMGMLIGQGIGRFGNFINQELYGPPTGSSWFGMIIPPEARLPQFASLPPDTRFHPTMLYEAFWLFLSFAVLYYLFRRYQEHMIQGVLTGAYFVLAGFGRFVMEFWRPDQPLLPFPQVQISYSRLFSMVYVLVGLIIILDRLGYLRIPFIRRPQTFRQRERAYQEMLSERRRHERARERERQRDARRKAREREAAASAEETKANP